MHILNGKVTQQLIRGKSNKRENKAKLIWRCAIIPAKSDAMRQKMHEETQTSFNNSRRYSYVVGLLQVQQTVIVTKWA